MNLLITGANGQLGSEFRLLSVKNEKDKYFFIDVAELDITDPVAIDTFIKERNIEIIVNCAAYNNVDKAEGNILLTHNKAVQNLTTVARERNSILIHVSTDYVFSGNGNLPYT